MQPVLVLLVCILLGIFSLVSARCPNNCHAHGKCNKFSQCECYKGYIGGDCSQKECPKGAAWADHAYATDKAHALTECSNRGVCDRATGQCTCMAGFKGGACERLGCNADCNNKGKCYSMHDIASRTRDSNSKSYTYDTEFGDYGVWDANKIHGCVCDPLYQGYDCSQFACVTGDDSLTTGQVNEVQTIKCTATTGAFTLWYKGYPSAAIPYDATAATVKSALLQIRILTDIEVIYSQPNLKACQINANVIKITFNKNFGPQPPLIAMMDTTMSAAGAIQVSADGVTPITDFSGTSHVSVKGTKENEICAGRGLCVPADGLCKCFDSNGDTYGSSNGYGAAGTRGDCGFITSGTVVSTCPGQIACNGHGLCDSAKTIGGVPRTPTYKCSCNEGWGGGDCSERKCPTGRDWFSYPTKNNEAHDKYSTCSNMGICDLTLGQCVCRDNFYGAACENMACGGGITTPCNGHGRCMSQKELAIWRKDNGEDTSFTYGMDPNFARTWDGNRVHGCLCDHGYTGYDCLLKTCPTGDDPFTYDQHVEVQLLTCTATEGKFRLSFREEITKEIHFNATAIEIRDALMALPTLVAGGVVWQKSTRHAQQNFYDAAENGKTSEEVNYPIRVFLRKDYDIPKGVLTTEKPVKSHPQGDPVHDWFPHRVNATSGSGDIVLPTRNVTSTFCNQANDQVAIIIFDAIHGDLPALKADITNLKNLIGVTTQAGVIGIYTDGQSVTPSAAFSDPLAPTAITSIKGTTEDIECNGRGICDRALGQCKCFTDWSSSDGKGGPGYVNDCGFQHDHKYASANSWWEGKGSEGRINPNSNFLESN
jgi:hypothetical protein